MIVPSRHTFPKSRRVRSRADFSAVFDARVRVSQGPLTLYGLPNPLNHPRLGLSTPRKVGIAARRNRIRRLLRESFRRVQHELPGSYDLIVLVRPHEALQRAEYQRLLSALCARLHSLWQSRDRSKPPGGPAPG